jgi:molybdopterin-binding protein
MLYVTHDQEEAYSLSRRVLVMEKGKVIADGEPRDVFSAPVSRERAVVSGYENICDATIEETHPALGTMTCRVAGTDLMLESPLAQKAAGEQASLAMRAGDILVATVRPTGISARNILAGMIATIEDLAGMVELRVLCGTTGFCVHITRGALKNLALEPGQAVWLIIKTHSIQFLRR